MDENFYISLYKIFRTILIEQERILNLNKKLYLNFEKKLSKQEEKQLKCVCVGVSHLLSEAMG